jgi:hypothetical protein
MTFTVEINVPEGLSGPQLLDFLGEKMQAVKVALWEGHPSGSILDASFGRRIGTFGLEGTEVPLHETEGS